MSNATILTCTNEEYHALRDSWSHSQIEDLHESPALFYGRHVATPPLYERKRSSAFDWGTVADAALTNPEGADGVMRIIPDYVLNSEGHRKGSAWLHWQADNAGKILLKASECAEILAAVRNCRANPKAAMILDAPGEFQRTIKWLDDETGLWLRCRLDKLAYLKEGLFPSDIKTCRSNRPRQFSNDAYEYGYHRQAAWYWDGLVEAGEEPEAWLNVTIGKPDPQECIVYEMKPEAVTLGREQNRKLLRELAERLESKDWHPREWNQVLELDMPPYAYRPNAYEVAL